MLDTAKFGAALKSRGYDLYSGVPCSFLKDLINDLLERFLTVLCELVNSH